ncbi:aminotransferase class V-fold PLP-dependent enzyme [Sulfurospirillum multivorans]|uniref:O-acetylhomoserine aminocarboxypropyltransferase n=2 Tax=Sulfurospirillum multivorans TaxID=66821 RepID=A0AA86AR99_SULMK|nr:aminotransferase class V-fold PLP-dependent enzyme [Sulfurospirillum multivorans]AHJ14321.1 O-acetylhomoserine aminocarboxypropyltransferase [Sulfurospirillum multivorans DSM 12446]QEH07807.1 O-acetylhomoserine aminocarboxypropyltransferase [Sulfurospirillum multivorans]
MGFTTKALHAKPAHKDQHGAMRFPIYQCSAFEFEKSEDLEAVFKGQKMGHVYTRSSNPSIEEFELKIKAISGAFGVIATATGMAAIANALFALVKSGDNIITTKYLFGNTLSLFQTLFSDFGVEVRYVDLSDIEAIRANIDAKTRLLFCESISNPQLIVPDFSAIKAVLKEHHVPLIVDTTATPWNIFDAKKHGVDIEIISATKYISGGGHVLGGLIVDNGTFNWKNHVTLEPFFKKFGPFAFMARLRKETFRNLGSSLTAQSAYLLSLGLETLDLRVQRSCQNALAVAKHLQSKAEIISVEYPLLENSNYFANASKQFSGGGGIVSFSFSDKETTYAFLNRLNIIKRGTNVQDNKSLAIATYHTIYAEYSDEQKAAYGLTEGMIRLSVGIEDLEDLLEDIDQALA